MTRAQIQRAAEWSMVAVLVMWGAALFVFGPKLIALALRWWS